MGEVWRATDSRLKRDVAIKVLPQGFIEDRERLARFEREAQLLAQLHHPNIASIFGLEDAGGVRALVMELVEGPTLAERLEAGPLPLSESLSIARQIAEALEEAHEKGIVHRDLKPQNIKAPIEGKTKVLDFGLAKAMDPAAGMASGSASQLAASPTLTMGATVQGMILGTAAYMAPEQAAGGAADRRADVWSFGVVLYEMLSGRRLFDGETVSHVLAGVLKDEPDFSALPDGIPPRILRLVRRCLRKRPRERLQAIGDARVVIEEVLAGPDRDEATAEAAVSSPRPSSWKAIVFAGASTLVVGLVAGWLLLAPRLSPPPASAPLRLELAVPEGWAIDGGSDAPALALSRDGRRIAAAVLRADGSSALMVQDLGELGARIVEGSEGGRSPFFSPDGEWLGFVTASELRKVPVRGGRFSRLAQVSATSRGAVWGEDGFIYFQAGAATSVSRVPDGGGELEQVSQLDGGRDERTHRYPELTVDGRALIFTADDAVSPDFYDDANIVAVELASGARHLLIEGSSQARMLGRDALVFARGGDLFAVGFDSTRLTTHGKPVVIEQGVQTRVDAGAVHMATSASGAAVWIAGGEEDVALLPHWIEADGTVGAEAMTGDLTVQELALAPDGKRLAVRASSGADAAGRVDLWVADLERDTRMRLTFGDDVRRVIWSPDSSRVIYNRVLTSAAGEQTSEIVWRPADGGGEPEVLLQHDRLTLPESLTHDGRTLVYSGYDEGATAFHLWYVSLDAPDSLQPFAVAPDYFSTIAELSPDDRWLAYTSDSGSGASSVFVQPFPGGGGKWQVSQGASSEPHWSQDGRWLYYRSAGSIYRVSIGAGPGFIAGVPERVGEGAFVGGGSGTYAIDAASGRLLVLPSFSGSTGTRQQVVNYSTDWVERARAALDRQAGR